MDLTEKIAYIKGLCDGLQLDENKPEVKVIQAIIDLLDDITYDVQDMEELYDDLSAQVDEIDQDLAEVESELYDDEEDDDGFDDDYEENPFYEVTCDSCGKKINVSEDVLLEGEIECPNCGEVLEFDFSDLFTEEDDEDCDGDCASCDAKDFCDEYAEEDDSKEEE